MHHNPVAFQTICHELCGFVADYALNPSAEVQELVMGTLVNFLGCRWEGAEEAHSAAICCYVLEFVEKRCQSCLDLCSVFSVADRNVLRTFRDQAQLVGFVGKNATKSESGFSQQVHNRALAGCWPTIQHPEAVTPNSALLQRRWPWCRRWCPSSAIT